MSERDFRCPRCEGYGDGIPQLPHILGCTADNSEAGSGPEGTLARRGESPFDSVSASDMWSDER